MIDILADTEAELRKRLANRNRVLGGGGLPKRDVRHIASELSLKAVKGGDE